VYCDRNFFSECSVRYGYRVIGRTIWDRWWLVIVPVLVILFTAQGFPVELVMLMAVATSLATIILTAIASVLAHHRLGSVVWAKVFYLSPGIIVGAAVGAVVAKHINADTLRTILVVFLIYVAIQMACN